VARPINAALYVPGFYATGNTGEWTFTGASYNNQADATGNGAYDAVAGAFLYISATDINSGVQIPGVVHRYVFTAVQATDANTLSGTILWNE